MSDRKNSTAWRPHRPALEVAFRQGRDFVSVADEMGLSRTVIDYLWRRWRAEEGKQPYRRTYITAPGYSVACDPQHAEREIAAARAYGPVEVVERRFLMDGPYVREVRQ